MFVQVLWMAVLVVLATIGAVAAPWASLGAVAFGFSVGFAALLRAREAAAQSLVSARGAAWSVGWLIGGATTAAWIVLVGLIVLLGPATGVVLFLLALTGATVWLWRRSGEESDDGLLPTGLRPGSSWPTGLLPGIGLLATQRIPPSFRRHVLSFPISVTPPDLREPTQIAEDLSIAKLVLVWQRTYLALLEFAPATPQEDIVQLRQQLLDEIERRDPEGFSRWLDSGARAGGNPRYYLADDR